jgi:hypothetical protein
MSFFAHNKRRNGEFAALIPTVRLDTPKQLHPASSHGGAEGHALPTQPPGNWETPLAVVMVFNMRQFRQLAIPE